MRLHRILTAEHLEKRAAMSEPEFWKIVDQMGWGTRTRDYKALSKAFMQEHDAQEAEAFRDTLRKLKSNLKKAISEWEKEAGEDLPVGDDGFDDLVSHIVGLGKREYDAVLKEPIRAFERAREGKYTESFSYAIPWESDYAKKDSGLVRFKDWANQLVEGYAGPAKHPAFAPVKADLLALSAGAKLIVDGKYQEFMAEADDLKAKAEKVSSYWNELQGFGSLGGSSSPLANKWALWNLVSDMGEAMTK